MLKFAEGRTREDAQSNCFVWMKSAGSIAFNEGVGETWNAVIGFGRFYPVRVSKIDDSLLNFVYVDGECQVELYCSDHRLDKGTNSGWPEDCKKVVSPEKGEGLEKTWKSKNVISVKMRDEDFHRSVQLQTRLQISVLGPLATIE